MCVCVFGVQMQQFCASQMSGIVEQYIFIRIYSLQWKQRKKNNIRKPPSQSIKMQFELLVNIQVMFETFFYMLYGNNMPRTFLCDFTTI